MMEGKLKQLKTYVTGAKPNNNEKNITPVLEVSAQGGIYVYKGSFLSQ